MAEDSEVKLRRFAKLSPDCVLQSAQSLGIQTSAEVTSALVEDASFRIRHIAETACQFMNHAKRKRLTTDDFDKALKWSRVEPLHGHQTGRSTHFSPTQNSDIFTVQDHEVDLTTVAMDTPVYDSSVLESPHVEASWISIEGAAVSTQGTTTPDLIELKREANEPNEKYMSVLMEALTGDKEDLRMVALTDLQKNPAIANILPDIMLYLQETLGNWLQFTPQQLIHLLKLALALFQNSHLFLEPYLPAVYALLKAIIFNLSYLATEGELDHWAVRQIAAAVVATLLHRCGSPLNDSLPDLHSSFHQLLSSPNPPLAPVYGAVLTLCHLSGDSLVKVLYPHMEELLCLLQTLLEGRLPTPRKDDALRVYEALLLGAELLLTGGYQLEEPPPPSKPSAPPESKPGQPPLPKETSSLFASNSFGLATESSDMEIENGGTHTDSTQLAAKKEQKIPSLYDHLIELFGERLLLRLSTHPGFTTSTTPTTQPQPIPEPTHKRTSTHTSPSLLAFLSEEGFKPLKVELPLSSLAHPPRMDQWSLNLPRTRLPVSGNILEQKSREAKRQNRQGRERRPPPAVFNKGVCASYRRHNSRSGLDNVGMHSAWL